MWGWVALLFGLNGVLAIALRAALIRRDKEWVLRRRSLRRMRANLEREPELGGDP